MTLMILHSDCIAEAMEILKGKQLPFNSEFEIRNSKLNKTGRFDLSNRPLYFEMGVV